MTADLSDAYPGADDTVTVTVRLKRAERELLGLLAQVAGDRSVNLIVASLIRTDLGRWYEHLIALQEETDDYEGLVGTVPAANTKVFCRLFAAMYPGLRSAGVTPS